MKQRSSTQTNPRPSKPGLHHQSLRCSALFLSFIAFTLLQYPQLARAQDADPANQSYIFNHHSPAFDASSPHFFDASAAATRPGQLPFVNESNAKYTFVTNNEAFAHGLYAATPLFANLKLGLAVDFVSATEDAPYFRQYRAGLGWRIADSLGLAAQYSSFASESSRQVDELSHWSLGFGFQPIPALFISAAAHRFDTPRYGDEWLDPLYRAQLSYALFDGQLRLDLGAQSDSENWPDGYYNSSLFSQISSWLELYAIAQSDLETARWGGGARLSMGSLSLESALFAASNSAHVNFDSLTVGLSWHPEAPETELFNDHRWLDISIPGSLPERPISSFFSPNSPAFLAFLNKIETLTQSQEYTGLLLRLDAIAYNYSQIYELRQSLKRLQAQGLTLVIHSDSTSSRALYLGAVADRLYFTPTTPVSANGILLRKTYYRGLLDHIGVLPEFVKIDEYKSAPDSYLRKTPTDTDREQTDDYLDALYSELVNGISSGRQIEPEIVRYALDNAPIMPNDALELGLFDGEVYSDQMHDRIRQELDPDAQFQTHHQDALANPWQDRPKIVVIVVDSAIVTGPSIDSPFSNSQVTGSKTIGEMLNQAAKDSEVAAIVLRIDSPGGSAHASELIHHAAQEAARSKPLVVSMGSVAASGGYYIATPADAIFATPLTLTGSIGIYAGKVSLEGLFDMLGLHVELFKRGLFSDIFQLSIPWNEAAKAQVKSQIEYLYTVFIDRVASGRNLDEARVHAAAEGHVWAASDALERGLIDQLGTLSDAVEHAAFLAQVDPANIDLEIGPSASVLVQLSLPISIQAESQASPAQLLRRLPLDALLPWLLFDSGEALAMLPYQLTVQ